MKGIDLSKLSERLHPVDPEHEEKPALTIPQYRARLAYWFDPKNVWFGIKEFPGDCHRLPFEAYQGFTFDEIRKIKHSTRIMMGGVMRDMVENDARHLVVGKIDNSVWRWAYKLCLWNELVETHCNLLRFQPDLGEKFEFRLDFTTGCNELGYSRYSRTFLDGVFAFLLYYQGKHVMTIGFSFVGDRRILIQQVQLAKRTGNRFLYRFPKNRLEYVISQFEKYFPGYQLFVIDGQALVRKHIGDHEAAMKRAESYYEQARQELSGSPSSHRQVVIDRLVHYEDDRNYSRASLEHIKSDAKRISSLYTDAGSYQLGYKQKFGGLPHHAVQ